MQIEAFIRVCETGSLSMAAAQLSKNRATITELIETLEISLGYQLFDRTKRPIQLTNSGNQLYNQAKLLLQEAEMFNQIAMQVPENLRHTLTIGYDCIFPIDFLHQLVTDLNKQKVQVNLLCIGREQAEEMLEKSMIDIGIYQAENKIINEHFKWRAIGMVEFAVYANKYYFGKTKNISMSELVTKNQLMPIFLPPNYLVKRMKIADHIQTISDLQLLKRLLNDSYGWAILPIHLFKTPYGNIRKLETELGIKGIEQTVVILWKPTINEMVEQVINHIQHIYYHY